MLPVRHSNKRKKLPMMLSIKVLKQPNRLSMIKSNMLRRYDGCFVVSNIVFRSDFFFVLQYFEKGIDETIKVASNSIDQKIKEANTFVDTKRQDLEKVLL